MKYKLINNKKGMELKASFFAMIIVSMVIISVGVVFSEWDTPYNTGISNDLSNDFDNLDSLSEEAQLQQSQITPQDADTGVGDFEGRIFRGGYGLVGRLFTPFRAVFNMLDSVEKRFDLPSYIAEGILTMMFFALITTIVAIIFRLPRQNA